MRQVVRQAQRGHHLGRRRDVEARLARHAKLAAAQAHDDPAQRAIVHVQHAFPHDRARVQAVGVAAVLQAVVDHRREEVVRLLDGVEIAGQVEIDQLPRHNLRAPGSARAALHAEDRPERRLPQHRDRAPADAVQRVHEADADGRLALAPRCRRHRGNEHEIARRRLDRINERERQFGRVPAVKLEGLERDAHLRRDIGDGTEMRRGAGSSGRFREAVSRGGHRASGCDWCNWRGPSDGKIAGRGRRYGEQNSMQASLAAAPPTERGCVADQPQRPQFTDALE